MAMPWSRAKQIERALRGKDEFPEGYKGSRTIEQLNALFDACFRIQREACEAAGRHIPLIVENVKGAQPWLGQAKWNFGSFYLWGDVPALMPITLGRVAMKHGVAHRADGVTNFHGHKLPGNNSERRWEDRPIQRLRDAGIKAKDADGYERNHGAAFGWKAPRTNSQSSKRKAASAEIAKIPFPLAQYIARTFK